MGITVPIKNKAHLSLKVFLITISLPVLDAEILCETEILSFSLTVYEKEWLRYIKFVVDFIKMVTSNGVKAFLNLTFVQNQSTF